MLEEFFIQGDKEKELCIPVQMLDDRDKVNRAFSQIGFIGRRLVADGNGLLDKEEFEDLLAEDYVFEVMEELGVHFPKQDLQEIFDKLDVDESGELTIEEFVEGVRRMQSELSSKRVVSLDYSIKWAQA